MSVYGVGVKLLVRSCVNNKRVPVCERPCLSACFCLFVCPPVCVSAYVCMYLCKPACAGVMQHLNIKPVDGLSVPP